MSAVEQSAHFEVRVTADSHLAWLRTRLSIERTLMAWVRTATALIAFGFSIVQFFERLKSMEGVAPAPYPHLARYFGLGLIAAGILGLLVSVWQYRVLNGYLWREFRSIASAGDGPRVTPTLVVSLVLLLIGIYAFVTVFTRAV